MSNFKKRIINVLKIDLDLKNKTKNLYTSNKKGQSNSKRNNKIINKFSDSEYENNLNLNNISSQPKSENNNYEDLTVKKKKLAKNLNIALFNTNLSNTQLFIHKNSIFCSLNTNKKKKDIQNIPKYSHSNNQLINKSIKDNKTYINISKNKDRLTEISTIFIDKQFKINKNKINKNCIPRKNSPILKELKARKTLFNKNKKKVNSYSKIISKKLENSRVSNKIKETIYRMEKEFSSSEVKKILINRPMRTLDSKLFNFNSKELKNFSPTLHVLKNSRIKKNNKKNKIYSLFSERYKNNIKKCFHQNCISLNNIYENKSQRTCLLDLLSEGLNSEDINNKSFHKNYIFNPSKKTNQKNNELYKEMKNKQMYQNPIINREYQECSKCIRNFNRLKHSLNNLLTSFSNNPEYSIKGTQISYEC